MLSYITNYFIIYTHVCIYININGIALSMSLFSFPPTHAHSPWYFNYLLFKYWKIKVFIHKHCICIILLLQLWCYISLKLMTSSLIISILLYVYSYLSMTHVWIMHTHTHTHINTYICTYICILGEKTDSPFQQPLILYSSSYRGKVVCDVLHPCWYVHWCHCLDLV